jgi:hypothetical protein
MKLFSGMLKLSVSIMMVSLLFSCSAKKALPKLNDKDVLMSFEKGSCLGKCAVYSLKIYKNKYALYTGTANTDKMGKHMMLLPDSTFNNLQELFVKADFDKLQSNYPSEIIDFPLVSVGYYRKNNVKVITYKETKPAELGRIQTKMEQISNSFGWTSLEKKQEVMEYQPVDGRNRQANQNLPQNEIIIQPKEDVNIDQWVKRYEGYKVAVKQKLAPNFNYYVITWDTEVIGSEEMLQKIKGDSEIILASFNKMITTRGN